MFEAVTREHHIGNALEAEIRSRVQSRSWYRRNRSLYAWDDYEQDNERVLRLLFSIRRDGIRQEREGRAHVERVYREMRAAHELAEWAESITVGSYVTLPDVPLADPGDHYAGMAS